MRLLPIIALLAGCAATGADMPTRDQRALTEELAGRTAGPAQRCIPARQNQSLVIVDSRTIVYRDFGTVWVNRLETDCPGLKPLNTLVVDAQGSQYCSGDRVRGVEPHSSIPGPFCRLRDFVPYRGAP